MSELKASPEDVKIIWDNLIKGFKRRDYSDLELKYLNEFLIKFPFLMEIIQAPNLSSQFIVDFFELMGQECRALKIRLEKENEKTN